MLEKLYVGLTIVLLGCGMEWCVVSMSELLSVLILVFLELDKSPISFYLRN